MKLLESTGTRSPRRLVYFLEDIYKAIVRLSKRSGKKREADSPEGTANLRPARPKFLPDVGEISLEPSTNGVVSNYEASNIECTRESEYWRWQRVKEYWQDIYGAVEKQSQEALALMEGNFRLS